MAQLPQEFLTRMQDMLGDEFDAFLTSYDAPRTAGLRVNTKKCRTEDFPPLVPGTWKKIPWIPNGYFVRRDAQLFPSRRTNSSVATH